VAAGPRRYLCIHGHFYQPPRENPWLEAVEVQDSAAPYHDWNERISRECYAPNRRARLLDSRLRIAHLLNNYAWISFNFGPTLLAWMEAEAPEVLAGIVEGDRLSRERRRGHGNALAQVYNHVIMPLASNHDRRTQVLWGIAEFRKRFGRRPEGMWLAETAADTPSLEALARAGIRFTVLSPRQAKRWRRIGDPKWTEIAEGIDPSRAYLCRLPSGRDIALFFYDAILSRQVAFERLLDDGERFAHRLMQGFDADRPHAQLMHIATDGESYGHHHPHGDMALAYALNKLSQDPSVKLTNYGEFLQLHPPEWEVEIHENSSWSCVHGVERWRSACGCTSRPDRQQFWREPLRIALDQLKGRLDQLFESQGQQILTDPWAARDAYIDVVLDRGEESVRRFLSEHARSPEPDPPTIQRALWLLEMQRHGMLMYTSCGWFFDEISGLETTQCLRYAARAIQLARHFDQEYEAEFVQALEKAPSNLPQFGNGRGVWEQLVRPTRADLERVLAHFAMSRIYRPAETPSRLYCYTVDTQDEEVRGRDGSHLAVGRLHVRSTVTWNEAETSFVVLHHGGLDFHTVLRQASGPEEYEQRKRKLFETFEAGSPADLVELVTHEFPGQVYRLDDLFAEERRRVIGIALQHRFAEYREVFGRLAEKDEPLLTRLARLHYPIPKPLWIAASVALDARLMEDLRELPHDGSLERLRAELAQSRTWGYQPERELLKRELVEQMRGLLRLFEPEADLPELIRRVNRVLDAAELLGISLDLWQTQNQVLEAYLQLTRSDTVGPDMHDAFARFAARLNISPDMLGWRP
jgi:alpha-amylase/alpha-mannosidase (GH57 family)